MSRPDDILKQAAATFAERNAIYGDNWTRIGAALQAMFPKGLYLQNVDDFVRFYYLVQLVAKLTRYANNFANGGHSDSAHDICVYSAMLEAFDGKENNQA